jgi:uncharacterized protein (DUF2132 family)
MNKLRLITGVFHFINFNVIYFTIYLLKLAIMEQPNNPLHGIKLATILEELTEAYSWEYLANQININCFKSNPSIKSSLKFLRRTPWAREKVEQLYLHLKSKKN